MTHPVSVPLAYFGKLPSRGDFVRSAHQGGLIQTLDRWLSQGVELMSSQPRWKEVYDRGPKTHFAFLSVHSPRAIAGHLAASADASGRRFPFVVAGAFEVAAPLDFIARAPMALTRLWARFEQATHSVCAADDAAPLLGELALTAFELDTSPAAYEASVQDFAELQSVGSLEAMLRQAGHAIDVRQVLLALGLLLQPVLAGGGKTLKKGLCLPLPTDPLYRPLVASFWLQLVTPFLARGDFEVALFLPQRSGVSPTLAIGLSGDSAAHLRAVLDPDAGDEAFLDPTPADWVEEHAHQDYAVKKLSSYLQQPQLSLRQATMTFREAFLGG
ncbi:MAG: type VI secretion system-associated protein TagF [Methylibium sp.]|uniref:type VI secretion system-associated protein TagF n=1 Tax=Methylibium sp. TaxID=2067992 RepID=UPI0017CF8EE7|nr:type VI secretion system-associated protein TagF [Methylibium sp.]MBA3596206.1 type VI secretion system-associated protein TagF [Methylibium sp.]